MRTQKKIARAHLCNNHIVTDVIFKKQYRYVTKNGTKTNKATCSFNNSHLTFLNIFSSQMQYQVYFM